MLTVLIATRNRARILHDVLEAYCHLRAPASGWKLVIIDNGSTDQTAQVIASYANRIPLELVSETRLGKNRALNAGLSRAEGDLTVFTDDDVFPHADWLVRLREAADAQPAYSMFGGVVARRWEVPPPVWAQWLEHVPVYSKTDPLLKEGPVLPWKILGANMCVRANVFQSATHFDPSIGPRGSSFPMGSETELLLRLGRQGHQAWHVERAVVEHFIQAAQLNKAWVAKRAIRFGRGQYRLFGVPELSKFRLCMGIPRYIFRDIFKFGLLTAAAWISFREDTFIRSFWRFNYLLGEAMEAGRLARAPGVQAQPLSSDCRVDSDTGGCASARAGRLPADSTVER
jgi:glycosyltransferase involved in cell wall biosynthesis